MNIMIAGQKWLATEAFKMIRGCGHTITGVAVPDEADRLADLAREIWAPVIVAERVLRGSDVPTDTDLIICAHAWCFITEGARSKCKYGALGYHPSLLPRHRGRDAIRWAIHMKEAATGGTVYWMNDHADGGPIAAQAWCHIRPGDDAASLWRRELAPMGLRLFKRVLMDLERGNIISVPQDESLATWEPSFVCDKLALNEG